ncbi:MAG: DUF5317 domain-containing protein [Thermoanaerobacteraceae bacterium]|nr:DUF5317 domain-containing protein [Thermoanaerobacteraceae bacterium]
MFIDVMVISLVIAMIRGVDLKIAGQYEIKGSYLFALGLLIEAVSVLFAKEIGPLRYWLYLSSFAFLLAAVYMNRDNRIFWSMGIGVFLNMTVIAINGGRMPVLLEAAKRAGLMDLAESLMQGSLISHVMITPDTPLWFLGDIIYIPKPYPRPDVLSIGDIFICIGLFFLIQDILVKKAGEKNGCRSKKAQDN